VNRNEYESRKNFFIWREIFMEELKTKLRQYQENSYYDDSDIAEKLIELSNLELTNDIKVELENAINYLNMVARNEYNDDQFRVLYNVLLVITGLEVF
jgi:hypothetical protein